MWNAFVYNNLAWQDRPMCDKIHTMTRSKLVEALADRFTHLTQKDADYAIKTILDTMSASLARGDRIEIRGFGSFSVSRRSPRQGRNPRTGESVSIPEKRVPHFKPGKALREAVSAQKVDEIAEKPTHTKQDEMNSAEAVDFIKRGL